MSVGSLFIFTVKILYKGEVKYLTIFSATPGSVRRGSDMDFFYNSPF